MLNAGRAAKTASPKEDGGGTLVGNFLRGGAEALASLPSELVTTGRAVASDIEAVIPDVTISPGGRSASFKVKPPTQTYEKVLKPTAQSYAYSYGPLVQGDFDEFYRRFHANPVQVALDATAFATLGATRVAAIAALPKGASRAAFAKALRTGKTTGPRRTIDLRLAEDTEPIPARTLPEKALRAKRMETTDALLKNLPPTTPLLGEFSRAARAVERDTRPVKLRRQHDPALTAYRQAFNRLTVRQRIVANALPRFVTAENARAAVAQAPEGSALRRELGDEKTLAMLENPPPNVLRVVELDREVTRRREENLLREGAISEQTIAEAPYRHLRILRGARVEPDLTPFVRLPDGRVGEVTSDTTVDVLRDDGSRAEVEVPVETLDFVDDIGEIPFLHRDKIDERLVGGPSVEQLRAELEAAGLPQPFYKQDVAEQPKGRIGGSSGRSPAQTDVRQSKLVLLQSGKLLLHPDTTTPAFLRAARHEFHQRRHEEVLRLAVPVDELPAGWKWVRRKRGERVPYLATVAGENIRELNEALRALPGEEPFTLGREEAGEIATRDGKRLAVPGRFAKVLEQEWSQTNRVMHLFFERPLAVWRALVLKLRVGWLEGNLFGNSLLYALQFAGRGGLRAVLQAIRTSKGGDSARRALGLAAERGALTAEDVMELLPELSRAGTAVETQIPSLGSERLIRHAPAALEPTLRKAHRVGSAILDFLPSIDRATEGALRRAGANSVLRDSAEVQALMKQGLGQRAAMRRALQESENLRRFVVREVNDALGDYLSLSNVEKTTVRSIIPFYAWLREITRITLKLPLNYPGRSAILAHLAAIDQEDMERPSFLAGFIPTGAPEGDIQPGVNLTPFNSFGSGVDTLYALATLAPGGASRRGAYALTGAINPALKAPAEYLVRASRGEEVSPTGALLEALKALYLESPEARVVRNPESGLYPDRTQGDLVRQFFGDPRRRVSISRAREQAREGR